MNHKPTSKLFRHLLATAVIAVATLALPRTASAGASDPIAYWLGGGGTNVPAAIAAGNAILKQTGASAQTTTFQQNLLDATQKALLSTNSNYIASGLPQKATASKLAIYMMKRMPEYAPLIAKWATQAALTDPGTAAPLKYSTTSARTTDAQKVAAQAMAIGLKTYLLGTLKNSTFPGLTVIKLAPGATAISSQVAQGAINAIGELGSDNATIQSLSYSLVKAAVKSVKKNPLTVGSTVVALNAQYAGIAVDQISGSLVEATIQGILFGSTKAGKKYINDIAQGTGYALFAVYQQTGGGNDANTYFNDNKSFVYGAMVSAGLKGSEGLREQIFNAFLTGIGTAQAQLVTLGAQAMSTDGFFAYNNGTGTPVTNVWDL